MKHAAQTFPREFLASGRPLSYQYPLTFVVNASRYRPLSARALDLECAGHHSVLQAYQNGDGRTRGAAQPGSRTLNRNRRVENGEMPLGRGCADLVRKTGLSSLATT